MANGPQESGKAQEPEGSGPGDQDLARDTSLYFERFIARHYSSQPPWLRTLTFLLFVLVVVQFAYGQLAGAFSVYGVLFERKGDATAFARYKEVRVGDRYFATNSKGATYLVLTPFEYYSLFIKGAIDVDVLDEDRNFHVHAQFQRLARELTSITIPPEPEPPAQIGQVGGPMAFGSVPSAWAAAPGGRLFLDSYEPAGRGAPSLGRARLQCVVRNDRFDLLDARSGAPAGAVPLAIGERMLFDRDLYFDVPGDLAGAHLEVLGEASFSLKGQAAPPRYGTPVEFSGPSGKVMAKWLSAYDVRIFAKPDFDPRGLPGKLESEGFRVLATSSTLPGDAPNAIFGGGDVPFAVLQQVLRAAVSTGLRVQTVQARLSLKNGKPNEIQIGRALRFTAAPAVEGERLRQILEARSESEFVALVAPNR